MAVSRLSGQDANGFGSAQTATATYPSKTSIGNLLIAVVLGNGGLSSNSITGAGTWIKSSELAANSACFSIFYKIATGTETTVTGSNGNGASTYVVIDIFEYNNTFRSILADGTGTSSSASATTLATAAITTTSIWDLVIVAAGFTAAITSPSWATSALIGSNISHTQGMVVGEFIPGIKKTSLTDTASWTTAVPVTTLIAGFTPYPFPTTLNNYQQLKVGDGMSTSEKIR